MDISVRALVVAADAAVMAAVFLTVIQATFAVATHAMTNRHGFADTAVHYLAPTVRTINEVGNLNRSRAFTVATKLPLRAADLTFRCFAASFWRAASLIITANRTIGATRTMTTPRINAVPCSCGDVAAQPWLAALLP